MLAVVVTGARAVRIDDLPEPSLPGDDGVVVSVEAAAICGSDLHFWDGDLPVGEGLPIGHEFVGRVVEAGPAVRTISRGDRVLVSSVAGCGRCDGCRRGDPVTCREGAQVFGTGMLGGGQAEAVAVPAADFNCLPVPDGLSDEAALLLTDALPTGWIAARRGDIAPGATVVVVGAGAIGQCAIRSAFVQGAARVLAVDPVAGRRELSAVGGAVGIDPAGGIGRQVRALTDARGADVVIEAVGREQTMLSALRLARPGGTVSIVGVPGLAPLPLPVMDALTRSLTIRFTTAPIQQTWRELVPLVAAGRLSTDGIFTDVFALREAAAAYQRVGARTGECLKVMLRP